MAARIEEGLEGVRGKERDPLILLSLTPKEEHDHAKGEALSVEGVGLHNNYLGYGEEAGLLRASNGCRRLLVCE